MSGPGKTSAAWLAVAAIAGAAVGATGMKVMRRSAAPAPAAPAAAAPKCPVHNDADGKLQLDDPQEAGRLRRALKDGVFTPWTQMGRAPTPAEFARSLGLSQPDADGLLDRLQACGESVGGGILRAPESKLIAVAWPLSNVPTDITVTTLGGKAAFARCAIDALGVSEMLQKRTVIEASARDNGAPIRIVVDVDKIVSAEPPGVVVVKGRGCDDMAFFSSRAAADAWRAQNDRDATLYSLAEALQRGARIFSRETAGL
jgi:hypothetical protein